MILGCSLFLLVLILTVERRFPTELGLKTLVIYLAEWVSFRFLLFHPREDMFDLQVFEL